jgi:putative ABC transport system permease protein
MDIAPIVSAMRRNKTAPVLVITQVSLTLAIVCNLLFIVYLQLHISRRASGIDEQETVSLQIELLEHDQNAEARLRSDLAAIRSLPGVRDAYATNAIPLGGHGKSVRIGLVENDKTPAFGSAYYAVDEHALATLNLHLVSGRWFLPDEVQHDEVGDLGKVPQLIIITQALAQSLFPNGEATGQTIYLGNQSTRILGVVQRLQTPWDGSDITIERSILAPILVKPHQFIYVIRSKAGQRDSVLIEAQKLLFDLSPQRIIDHVETFEETRAAIYSARSVLSTVVAVVSVLLLLTTSLGIIGLTSYWVSMRRRQIGIRRTLGARRVDIQSYFHTENILVTGVGVAIGMLLILGGNAFMVSYFAMTRLPTSFAVTMCVVILLLGQLSVIWPAVRAANVPPGLSSRPSTRL